MNRSTSTARCTALLLLAAIATGSALAEKFPYRTLEPDKVPLKPIVESPELTLLPLKAGRIVTPGAGAIPEAPAPAATGKVWDAPVKAPGKTAGNVRAAREAPPATQARIDTDGSSCKNCTAAKKP